MYFLLFYVLVALLVAISLVIGDKDRGTFPKLGASVVAGLMIGSVWPILATMVAITKFFSFFWPKLK